MKPKENLIATPYLEFDREHWATLRDSVPLTLTGKELSELKGINEELSMEDVIEIYLPFLVY